MESKTDINVFVTYASGLKDHDQEVLSFVHFLRQNGFNAVNDKLLKEQESSVDWWELMLKGLAMEKVIVVLSPLYLEKSQKEKTGVHREYQYILSDIEINKNKYIFVVFETPVAYSEIAPPWFLNREVINLSKDIKFKTLFSKLLDKSIPLPPVSDLLPEITDERVPNFLDLIKKKQN